MGGWFEKRLLPSFISRPSGSRRALFYKICTAETADTQLTMHIKFMFPVEGVTGKLSSSHMSASHSLAFTN